MKEHATFEYNPPARKREYDWDKLLNGRVWELTQGEDFDCQVISLRNQVYAMATARGVRVRSSATDTSLTLQAVPW